MSWNFSISGMTRDEVKSKLTALQSGSTGTHCPAPIFAAAVNMVDAINEIPDRPIACSSYGHIEPLDSTYASNAVIDVHHMPKLS